MTVTKIIPLTLFVGGFALVIIGLAAGSSFSSGVAQFFAGLLVATKADWMILGGSIAAVIGAISLYHWESGPQIYLPVEDKQLAAHG